ncbi:GGDEF domain-containing protein [Roseomonas sp. HF4]|uniref:GGDEF domain-containing protein n=1 Tax=Roseomonas sp. HF4 TaxID=2562313 RepID=UPI0010C148B0|nr:GGDEF domain-containing protein [Roseomonas sp. HF4]
MSLLGKLHVLLSLGVLVASLGAAGAGAFAAWTWRHHKGRFMIATLSAAAALVTAAASATALTASGAPGWSGWLRLLPDAMLPALLAILLREFAQRDAAARRAAAVAPIHAATGLPNRAALHALALPALARARREGGEANIVAAALDDLPGIEAARGPAAAREALHDFAVVLRDTMRAGDIAGHLGPSVLGVMLHGADPAGAAIFAARLRKQASERLSHPAMDGRRLRLTIGIAQVGGGTGVLALDEAFAAAETAVATAQSDGGDRVVTAAPPPPRSADLPSRATAGAPAEGGDGAAQVV